MVRRFISVLVKFHFLDPKINSLPKNEHIKQKEDQCHSLNIVRPYQEDFLHRLAGYYYDNHINPNKIRAKEPYQVGGAEIIELIEQEELQDGRHEQVDYDGRQSREISEGI